MSTGGRRDSGSLLRQLQISYALATLLVAGLMAVFMDAALHRSLDAEDSLVMNAQADALARRLSADQAAPGGSELRPEKAEWRRLGSGGRVVDQSPGMAVVPDLPWPSAADGMQEIEAPGGHSYSVLVRNLPDGLLLLAMDRSHEASLVLGFRRTLGVAVGLAVLLAALLSRAVARRALRPLHHIAQEAGDIQPSRLERRLRSEHFPAELGELVDTLNGTLARLQEAFHRLDRMATELAHELRTPLQNLRSEVESMLLKPKDEAASREALGSVLEECDRLARLIEQMLFLARSEHPAAAIERKPVNALQLVRGVAEFFAPEAEELDVQLHAECPDGLVIQGDEALLQRALHNLAANALRHTPAGGMIQLGASEGPDALRLWIRNSGGGMQPEVLHRLGERWVRGAESRGLGLGLAIVKGIAQLHGGTFQVESSAERGTEATLLLPRA